jgi:hypothetical protein
VEQPSEPSAAKSTVALSQVQENSTPLAERVEKQLDIWLDVFHMLGKKFIGPLWMTLFESVQDAIALGLLV